MTRVRIGDHLDVDLEKEVWLCARCGASLGSALDNYKKGCLVSDRDPSEVYRPVISGNLTFSPDPSWCRILEFYCPNCGAMIESEALPPGHPITHDISLDLDALRERLKEG